MKFPQEDDRKSSSYQFNEESDSPPNGGAQDFSEYMWMGNEEEFDKEVMKQLEEEALMEQCIEAMLEDELENKTDENSDFIYDFQKMCVQEKADLAKKSTLNPDAAEFVPRVCNETKS